MSQNFTAPSCFEQGLVEGFFENCYNHSKPPLGH